MTRQVKWANFTPTFINSNSKSIPRSPHRYYYWDKWHIVTSYNEYKQEGNTLTYRLGFKRLSFWKSVKFWVKIKLSI